MSFKALQLDHVNRAEITLDGIAGKSINVAKVLKTLGAQPLATGFLGGAHGEEIFRGLQEKSIQSEFVSVSAATRQCITVVDQNTGKITELVEESRPVTREDFEKLLTLISRKIKGCQAAIMSGTIAPGGTTDFYRQCAELAVNAGALAIIDAQGPALEEALKARPAVVKPNRQELERTFSRKLSNDDDLFAAMRQLHERGAERVVVTAGKAMVFALHHGSIWRIRPPQITPVNPIGSGDAFAAGLTWSLLRGDDLGEACCWAAATGAANALFLMPGELELDKVRRLRPATGIEKLQA